MVRAFPTLIVDHDANRFLRDLEAARVRSQKTKNGDDSGSKQPVKADRATDRGVASPDGEARHSEDFTSVNWFGTHYTFAKGHQAESVKRLWLAWDANTPDLSEQTIRERIGSSATKFQLSKVFRMKTKKGYRKHPAWDTMIVSAGKGVFRLNPPNESSRIQLGPK
jgi:hypothetical protein